MKSTKVNRLQRIFFTFFISCILSFLHVHNSQAQFFVKLDQQTDIFSTVYAPQHATTFTTGFRNSRGPSSISIRSLNRFNETDIQWEANAYPSFGKWFYSYLNLAYSTANFLPEFRGAAELFIPWPKRFEFSAGIRYLRFNLLATTKIRTFSVSYHAGPFLFTVRPYFIYSGENSGETYTGSVRYFLNEKNDYVLFRTGFGQSHDQLLFQLGGNLGEELLLLESKQFGVETRQHISNSIAITAGLDLNIQELSFQPNTFVSNWSFKGGLMYLF